MVDRHRTKLMGLAAAWLHGVTSQLPAEGETRLIVRKSNVDSLTAIVVFEPVPGVLVQTSRSFGGVEPDAACVVGLGKDDGIELVRKARP